MTKTNDKLDEILKEIIIPLVGLRCRNVYQVDKLEPDDRCETCDTYERLDIAKQAIEAYIKEREAEAYKRGYVESGITKLNELNGGNKDEL